MLGGGTDPVRAGLVESLARPGGNVTGITNLGREIGGKRLELFKEAVPKVARVAVLYNPASPGNVLRGVTVNLGAELAQKLGVPLELVAYAAAAASELGYRCKGEG
jgi:putative ABC transport system substrate-binding protein